MKPFKSLSNVRLLLCASLFLASCGEQTELEQPGVTNGETVEVTKEIQISVLPMQTVGAAATRSASDKPEKGEAIGITYMDDAATRVQTGSDNMTTLESTIKDAYILHFEGTAPTSKLKKKQTITSAQLTGGSAITCSFTMTAGVKNRVYVVANCSKTLTEDLTTLQQFEEPVDYTPSASLLGTGLPMSAMQDIGVGDVVDVFQLKSVLAKLTFKTSAGTLKLKGVPSGYSFHTQAQPGDNAVRPAGMTYKDVALTSGTTYYVPENMSGRNDLLIKHYTRALGMAAANAMYVEITNSGTVYNLLLGDGSASDFNFAGGYAYNINATLYGVDAYDLRIGNTIPVGSVIVDMNASGETANCYVATAANTWYMFNSTVMGNGATTPAHMKTAVKDDLDFPAITSSKLNPVSANVLWESINTATAPSPGTIVNNNLYLLKDRFLFKSGSTAGNAVIAAKDASDNVIWSWHIWRTVGVPVGITLATITDASSFTAPTLKVMDRNLGALRATPNSDVTKEQDYGLFYQWGRKDPFPTQGSVTTAAGGNAITPADAVKNPTTFYTGSDWTLRNDNLWGCPLTELTAAINTKQFNKNAGSKSIYDPCPVGWKVMPAYAFANAAGANSPWNGTNKGRDFKAVTTSSSTPFFLPASGYRYGNLGTLGDVGASGGSWTSGPNATNANNGSNLYFDDYFVLPTDSSHRPYGRGVRCVQS